MTHIRNIDIGEVLGLEILAEKFFELTDPLSLFCLNLLICICYFTKKNLAFTGLMARN